MKVKRYLLDSTLRDGEQQAGVCFSPEQKIAIASLLDSYSIHQIEAGAPAVSKQEKETIAEIIANKKNAVISVWSRLMPGDIELAMEVKSDIIHFSVPVSEIHIYKKLQKDKDWVLKQMELCLKILSWFEIKISVGLEDAMRADKEFMSVVVRKLLERGVTRIRLADTVGIATPSDCREVLKDLINVAHTTVPLKNIITDNKKPEFGIHAHNDLGMAVANTIEAAKSGCMYADVTVGGIGERAGKCDLAKLVQASSSIFDWGMSVEAALELQEKVREISGHLISSN